MQALTAPEGAYLGNLELTPFNPEGQPLDQRLCDLLSCRFDDPAEGPPGNPHLVGRIVVVAPLKIDQPHRFKLVHAENDFFKHEAGTPAGLK